jgi:hypothetical protein
MRDLGNRHGPGGIEESSRRRDHYGVTKNSAMFCAVAAAPVWSPLDSSKTMIKRPFPLKYGTRDVSALS